jgi:predicted N-acetyltransferase YhbS
VALPSENAGVTIGPLREEQIAAVARLRCDAFFQGSDRTVEDDEAGLGALLADGVYGIALVAEEGGIVAGSCLFVRNEIEPAHDVGPWLAGLIVAEPFRGRGIGRRLVSAIEAHCANLDCRTIYLYTHDAEDFYAAIGWQVVERFVDQSELMVVMSRRLAEEE